MGVVFLPIEYDDLESVPLFKEELALAISINAPLAKRKYVTLEILKTNPSILLPNTYYIRQLINKTSEQFGFAPHPVMEMTTVESIINMVSKEIGVTILSTAYLNYINHPKIKIISIRNPKLTTSVGIVYRKNKHLCTTSHFFIDRLIATSKSK